jgi:hypothetical protein
MIDRGTVGPSCSVKVTLNHGPSHCIGVYADAQIAPRHGVMILSDLPGNWRSITMKRTKTVAATLLASALIIILSGCDSDGPLEDAGEAADDQIEDAGDAIEDATDGD